MCHFTTFGHVMVALWFFENFSGGGEMDKVHGILFLTQNELSIQKKLDKKLLLCENE
jgi:hypothetical protein